MKWIADIRVGVVGVYYADERVNCFSDIRMLCKDSDNKKEINGCTYWDLPESYKIQAKIIALILNLFNFKMSL